MKDEHKTKRQLIEELAELRRRVAELEASWEAGAQLERALQQRTHDLGERVKELGLLYLIAGMCGEPDAPLEVQLQRIVEFMPTAWQHPQFIGARIVLDGRTFKSRNFKETRWRLTQDIVAGGRWVGVVDVCYLGEWPERDGEPFVEEERNLINAVANRLADAVEKRLVQAALRESEELSRGILQSTTVGMYLVQNGMFQWVNPSFRDMTGYPSDELLALDPLALVHAEDREAVHDSAVQQLKGKSTAPHEFRLLRRDGAVRWMLERVASIQQRGKPAALGSIVDITRRKQAEEALRDSEARLNAFMENAPDAIYISDLSGNLIDGNRKAEELTGYSREELIGANFLEIGILPGEYAPKAVEALEKNRMGEPTGPDEFELVRKDGSRVLVEISTYPVSRGNGVGVIGIARDITERKRMEDALRDSERRYRLLAENATDIIWTTDMELRLTYVSPSVERLRGYTVEESMRQTIVQIFVPASVDLVQKVLVEELELEKQEHKNLTRSRTLEVEVKRRDGSTFWSEMTVAFLPNEAGEPVGIVGISRDITERKKVEDMVRHMAYHDSLTGLPNRVLFREILGHELVRAERNHRKVAVMLLDLDDFKSVNDTLGHSMGDLLLESVAERLRRSVRKGDTIARMGGDEFMLILPEMAGAEDAARVARKILGAVARPFDISGHRIRIGGSTGIAVYPGDGADTESLMKKADIAMYRAKAHGGNTYRHFSQATADEVPVVL